MQRENGNTKKNTLKLLLAIACGAGAAFFSETKLGLGAIPSLIVGGVFFVFAVGSYGFWATNKSNGDTPEKQRVTTKKKKK